MALGGVAKWPSDGSVSRVLVTAALPYVYQPRHFGHLAGVYLPADVYARYCRLKGRQVLFVCGTDENAATTILQARRQSISARELSDTHHPLQEEVFRRLGISFDIFSRTSRPIHHQTVWEFYRKLDEKGLIRSDEVRQPFCQRCGEYLPDRFVTGRCPKCGAEDQHGESCEACAEWLDASELVDARCTLCGSSPVYRTVRHSFLRLSELGPQVKEYVRTRGLGWRRRTYNKTISWLEREGLKDKDITRDYNWGPRAPFLGPGQVIYNWAENLLGYISAVKDWASSSAATREWQDWWLDPQVRIVCFLGKDNLFFHTILFPALLLGHGGYALPSQIVVNEFVNLSGEKMSTSRGHVIWLHHLLEAVDPEAIRYYAAAIAPENRDSNFSWEDLVNRVNTDLADNIGNLVNRVLVLANKVLKRNVPPNAFEVDSDQAGLVGLALGVSAEVEQDLESFQIRKALRRVASLARAANRYLNEAQPWKDSRRAPTIIWSLLRLLGVLAVVLSPFLPTSAERIWRQLGQESSIQELGWDRALRSLPRTPAREPGVLFRKIPLHLGC